MIIWFFCNIEMSSIIALVVLVFMACITLREVHWNDKLFSKTMERFFCCWILKNLQHELFLRLGLVYKVMYWKLKYNFFIPHKMFAFFLNLFNVSFFLHHAKYAFVNNFVMLNIFFYMMWCALISCEWLKWICWKRARKK